MPNLHVLATSCVGPEPRSLPSTNVTRLRQNYRPCRHPRSPRPSLAGFSLSIAAHVLGFPCCVRFPCLHAVANTPAQRLGYLLALNPQSYQPSPIWQSGRPAHRLFRGLLSVHSRYDLHTRPVTLFRDAPTPEASTVSSPPRLLRLLPAGAVAGWGFHPPGSAAFSRRTPQPASELADPVSGCLPRAERGQR